MNMSTVSRNMTKHLFLIASATALVSACGPSEPEPMRPPPADDTSEPADTASTTSDMDDTDANSGMAASQESSETAAEADTGGRLDVEAAMNETASDGVWVTQPNWTGYGPANSEAVFMLQCGEYGMIRMTRVIDIESREPLRAAVAAADEEERGFWKIEDQQENPAAIFEVYAESPVFDAMKTADTIAVLAADKPNLIMPGSDELTQQINSCQNQGSGTP